uniref:Ribonuclease P/MRP subunit p38 n=1 Tax=Calidris pygmaea TaxID=425635 RepID=A0A8C3KSF4_9CHAR
MFTSPLSSLHSSGGKTQKNLRMSVIQQGTATLRKAKKITVKTCLDNPFVFQWKTIDGEDMHFILQTLEERLKHTGLKKIETPRKKKCSPTKKQIERKCDASTTELPKEETEGDRQKAGWTDISIRRQLAIGVNEVTKALEKNELLLLLVSILCQKFCPPWLRVARRGEGFFALLHSSSCMSFALAFWVHKTLQACYN